MFPPVRPHVAASACSKPGAWQCSSHRALSRRLQRRVSGLITSVLHVHLLLMSQAPGTVAFLGDEGRINLVSLKSRQLTGTLKMAGTARAAAFAPDGQQLLSLGADLTASAHHALMLTTSSSSLIALRPTFTAATSGDGGLSGCEPPHSFPKLSAVSGVDHH
jgi:hypothetical protein